MPPKTDWKALAERAAANWLEMLSHAAGAWFAGFLLGLAAGTSPAKSALAGLGPAAVTIKAYLTLPSK